MEGHVFIKPQKGLIVRDPIRKNPLSEDGEWKPIIGVEGRYWNRRILDKSVIVCELKVEKDKKKEGNKWQ